jgi:2-phospho-L-lactate/phosphoenolpyruvate guanylyltransferase
MRNAGEFVLIPAKGIATGKSRLSGYLTASDRETLNRTQLSQTLRAAVGFFGREFTFVVSGCELVRELADEAGVNFVVEQVPSDLNGALEEGRRVVLARGARMISVLPVDLPCISAERIHHLLVPRITDKALIVPDRAYLGTNFLRIAAEFDMPFSFGERSFSKHLAQCRSAGIRANVVTDSCLSEDLDEVADLLSHFQNGNRMPMQGRRTTRFWAERPNLQDETSHSVPRRVDP